MKGKLLKCSEVAERYDVSVETVWRWVRTGRLQAVKLPGTRLYRIMPESLEEFEQKKDKA